MEFRIKDCQLQANEGSLSVGGYINVTERESEMLYNKKKGKWFKEVMKRGVFKRAIEKANKSIPLLFEHNWNRQLASIEDGSLTLREDNIGLRFDAVIKDETIYKQVKDGIINSCSFGFRALSEDFETVNARLEKRFVSAIELLEVSLVKNPAYVGSLCETRSYEEELLEAEEKKCETTVKETVEELVDDVKVETIEEVKTQDEKTDSSEERTEVVTDGDFENSDVEDSEKILTENENDYIRKIVEELIEAKFAQIKEAELVEQNLNQELAEMKEYHKSYEKDVEDEATKINTEVLKLRLQLLKLKDIKRGI